MGNWHDRAMSIEVVYSAESTATGGGRDGHVKSTDGKIDLDTRPPRRWVAAARE
jgi:organic hydroperoxide reductase OsmC/OhrA